MKRERNRRDFFRHLFFPYIHREDISLLQVVNYIGRHIVYQDSLFVFFQLYQILAGVMFPFQELFYSKAVFVDADFILDCSFHFFHFPYSRRQRSKRARCLSAW